MNEMIVREQKGKSLFQFPKDYVVVDIETTGLNPQQNEIIEIGCIKVRDHKIVDSMSVLLKSEHLIPAFITNLTGISNKMVEEKGVSAFEGLAKFLDFVDQDIIVGHNVNFDINFLYDHSLRHLGCYVDNDFVDTVRVARRLLKGKVSNCKLGTLVEYFQLDYSGAHRALQDCKFTYHILEKLRKY